MMRFVILAILGFSLMACTVREGAPISSPPVCNEVDFAFMVGRLETDIAPGELPSMYRFIAPNTAVTKDLRPERLNLFTDASGVVIRITCG